VLTLGALLSPAPLNEHEALVPSAPVDPCVELEAARAKVMADARDAGLAQGRADAQREIERAVAQARADLQAGNAELERGYHDRQAALSNLIASLNAEVDRIDQQMLDAACVLAMTALTRLLGEGATNGDSMRRLCQSLVADARTRPLVLHIAPGDADAVRELPLPADVRLEIDPHLPAGTCRLDSPRGRVETSLASRLHAIAEALGAQEPLP
jgi:flagellar biosynthesis/type III secretory pathway protein FliH